MADRLTEKQRAVLEKLSEGWRLNYRKSDDHWWLSGRYTVVPHKGTMRVLVRRHYVTCVGAVMRPGEERYDITPAGRRALQSGGDE